MNVEQREREIAEVEHGRELLSQVVYWLRGEIACGGAASDILAHRLKAWKGIMAREQARLAELRRGMKEGSE